MNPRKLNLSKLFYYKAKGLNSRELSEKFGLHQVYLNEVVRKFKKMDESEFTKILKEESKEWK